jgi:hypothetical protein
MDVSGSNVYDILEDQILIGAMGYPLLNHQYASVHF